MNTEIMNNIEEVTEMATETMENVIEIADNGFGKGVAVGVGAGLLIAGGIKLVVAGVKKLKAKKNAPVEAIEVELVEDDSVLEEYNESK